MAALDLLKRALPGSGSSRTALVAKAEPAHRLHPVLARLTDEQKIAQTDAERANKVALETNEHVVKLITRLGLVSAEDWAIAAAAYHEIQRAPRSEFPKEPVLPDLFSARYLKNAMLLPLDATEDTVWLGMVDPGYRGAMKSIALAASREVVPVVISYDDFTEVHGRFWEAGSQAISDIVSEMGDVGGSSADTADELLDRAKDAPVVRLVNQLLRDAARLKASDMHIEPYRDRLRVRYRVHGMLRDIGNPPAALAAAVISRFKILAKLDIAERRLPQDGQARVAVDQRRIDIRIATIPTIHGESLVIRFLGVEQTSTQLDMLGLNNDLEKRLRAQFNNPYGMLLVTGPTGSGKTTTLYAGIKEINQDDRKILTIEDPVEYQIEGLTQIQVKNDVGLGFATILRSVVRHDPDIIMVGETRDHETAEIAVHAALTGHLLLSTLHTNNAAGAIARMLDLGVEPYLLASVLRGVVGQRLVGKICPHCREPHAISPAETALFAHTGVPITAMSKLYTAPGCDRCEGLGYVGRLGLFEFLEVSETIRDLIRDKKGSQAIQQAAASEGMTTMLQYGLLKALNGETTFAEVTRVTQD